MNPSPEAAELAAAQPPEVDAELVRLRPRQHLVDRELALEPLLVEPAFLVYALALDHRDLRRRAAPGEAAELEKAEEKGGRRIQRAVCLSQSGVIPL
jgi:hypothetical protein